MSIFLTGANGFVGGTVAMRLMSAGYTVRGLVRDEEKARQVEALGIDPVIGSLDDLALLTREGQALKASSIQPTAIIWQRSRRLSRRLQARPSLFSIPVAPA